MLQPSPEWSTIVLPTNLVLILDVWRYAGLPVVREKSGKTFIFQGQGKVREFCKKSGKIFGYGQVSEKSGNFVMNAHDAFFVSQSYTLMLLILMLCTHPGGKILASFCDIFPTKEFPWKKCVCWTQFIDLLSLRHDTYYFVSQINFHLHYREAKNMSLKIVLAFLDSGILEKKIIQVCLFVSHWGGSIAQDDFLLSHVSYRLQWSG